MPNERALLPRDIRFILEWAERWRSIPTMKEIARKVGCSEATVSRIVRDGGYKPVKRKLDIEALAGSTDVKLSVNGAMSDAPVSN